MDADTCGVDMGSECAGARMGGIEKGKGLVVVGRGDQ